jgi:hypothetical protein
MAGLTKYAIIQLHWSEDMGTRKRLLYFILLNIVVSAVTTWIVASLVMRNFSPPEEPPTADMAQSDDGSAEDLTGADAPVTDDDNPSGETVQVAVGQLEIDTVIGAGDLENERVLVRHIGDQEVMLLGWKLQDEDGNEFSFPALTMFSGGAVTVYSKAGTNTVVEMYWGQQEAVWRVGESVYLVDPNGDIQAVFTVP